MHAVAFDNGLVGFSPTDHVVLLNREYFAQDVGCPEGFECPNLHLTKSLASKLRLTSKRLLGDK